MQGWRAIKRDAARVFGNNSAMAWEWFVSPAITLDNKSPMDLASAGNLQLVRDYLVRLEYGVYM
jgi:putative toxin-antitoxin system antitoxin component (TIGR02293 family)